MADQVLTSEQIEDIVLEYILAHGKEIKNEVKEKSQELARIVKEEKGLIKIYTERAYKNYIITHVREIVAEATNLHEGQIMEAVDEGQLVNLFGEDIFNL